MSGLFQKGKAWGGAVLLLLAFSASAHAQLYFTNGNFVYYAHWPEISVGQPPDESWRYTVSKYLGSSGVIAIPGTVNGGLVTKVGQNIFYDCRSVPKMVTIPDNGEYWSIESGAFYGCSNLTNVVFPYRINDIGEMAFYACTSLTNIALPSNNFCNIGSCAFSRSGLQHVQVPGSGVVIQPGAFSDCAALTAITVHTNSSLYSSTNGILFNKNKSTLMQYPAGIGGNCQIPGSVTNIAGAAFGGCVHLPGVYFSGAAPTLTGTNWFDGATNATVYRLPGAAGWPEVPEPWAGRPTALWLPETKADASLGVQDGKFGFSIDWASGQTIVVEAATNLADPVWIPVGTNVLDGDSTYFGDSEWTNLPDRFYRLVRP